MSLNYGLAMNLPDHGAGAGVTESDWSISAHAPYNRELLTEIDSRLLEVLLLGRMAGEALKKPDNLEFHRAREAFRYHLKSYLKYVGIHLYSYLRYTLKEKDEFEQFLSFERKVTRHVKRLAQFLDACSTNVITDKEDLELDFYAYVSLLSDIHRKEIQRLYPLYRPN